MISVLNLRRLLRLRKEACAREDWPMEYHYGMSALAGAMAWGLLLSIPSFALGWLVFAP